MSSRIRKNLFFPPHLGGEGLRFVQETFKSNYIAPLGPMVDAFEREFSEKVGIPYAAEVSSETADMHLGLGEAKMVHFTSAKHNAFKGADADYE